MEKLKKDTLVITEVMNSFESFKNTNEIEAGYGYVYDLLYEKGLLPKHTKSFREEIQEIALKEIENELKAQSHLKDLKSELNLLKKGFKGVKGKCKQIVLSRYFSKLINKGIDILEELKN